MNRKSKKVKKTSNRGEKLVAVICDYSEVMDALREAMPKGALGKLEPGVSGLIIDLAPKCTKAAHQVLIRVLQSHNFVLDVHPDFYSRWA